MFSRRGLVWKRRRWCQAGSGAVWKWGVNGWHRGHAVPAELLKAWTLNQSSALSVSPSTRVTWPWKLTLMSLGLLCLHVCFTTLWSSQLFCWLSLLQVSLKKKKKSSWYSSLLYLYKAAQAISDAGCLSSVQQSNQSIAELWSGRKVMHGLQKHFF